MTDLKAAAEAAKAAEAVRGHPPPIEWLMFTRAANPAAILALYAERDAAIARAEKAEMDAKAMCDSYAEEGQRLFDRAEAAEASLAAITAERDALREVYLAARGLCIGVDWNKGTHAIERGYRKRLIEAVNAVEATNAPPKTAQELNPDTLRYGNKRFKRKEPTNAE